MDLEFDWSQKGIMWRVEAQPKEFPKPVGVAYLICLRTQNPDNNFVLLFHIETFSSHRRQGVATAIHKEIEKMWEPIRLQTNSRNKAVATFLKTLGYKYSKIEETYVKWRKKIRH